jgi:hypothetical protein
LSWVKQKPIEGFRHCGKCSPRYNLMPLSESLSIGFGEVTVTKDDEVIWSGDDSKVLLRKFEHLAKKDPDHDYRVNICGPMYECEYQRHGDVEWALISRGEGFA